MLPLAVFLQSGLQATAGTGYSQHSIILTCIYKASDSKFLQLSAKSSLNAQDFTCPGVQRPGARHGGNLVTLHEFCILSCCMVITFVPCHMRLSYNCRGSSNLAFPDFFSLRYLILILHPLKGEVEQGHIEILVFSHPQNMK